MAGGRVGGRRRPASFRTSPPARAASARGRKSEIANFLETGFTPDFDSVGGAMVAVQKNIALLTAEDRAGDRCLSEGGAAASERLSRQAQPQPRRLN